MTFSARTIAGSLAFALASAVTVAAHADNPSADACATASDNAQPLRKAGKLREAKRQLLVCVSKSCPAMVRDDCASQLNDVEAATPTVVFDAKDSGGNDLTSVVVSMDGALLTDHLDGTSLAVDPGKRHFIFKTPGSRDIARDFLIREGEKDRHESISFSATPVRESVAESGAAKDSSDSSTSSSWPAYTAFGVGAAGIVVGSIFGVLALGTKSSLGSECPSKSGCPQGDVDALSTRAWVSNIGFAVGIIGAGVGTILLLTSGREDRPAVGIEVGPTHVGLVGTLP